MNVKVTDWKRFVKTTQAINPSSSCQPKASTSSSSQLTKRPAFSRTNYSSGKKAKVVKGKKQDPWALITSDKWVLSILRRGLELQFLEQPPLSPVPINLSVTKDSQKNQLLQDEVNILIQKGVSEEVNPPFHLGFYSRLFLVPKKNGKMRPVLDLSFLIISSGPTFQNGDQQVYQVDYSSSNLNNLSRFDGHLFSHPNFSVSSEQGNSSSVSQSRYNSVSETCSRQSKSSDGCSLPFPCLSEHRMGNSSISVSGDPSLLGSSSYRSVCHQSESQVEDLRFSHSRREA
ncbi:Hypothetical predicted protein [Mytilus galloprovincialis]|uniref:Uncharacterized protein n=1 Tax=Mytilus galloprovincialis TaxID=29158 RepID=A0A8B6D6B5_MYTGA|nr:Hypothetical predicted protein [Mytilus galloprovincialis]